MVKKLSVSKDGGDVDAITASTITSRAYTLAVANALDVFARINAGNAAASGDTPVIQSASLIQSASPVILSASPVILSASPVILSASEESIESK